MSEQAAKWDVRWDETLNMFIYISPAGEEFVPARADDPVDYEYVPKTPGLTHLRLTKRAESGAVARVERRVRRARRALQARGLA